MMSWIVRSSLKFRFLVVALAGTLLFVGASQLPAPGLGHVGEEDANNQGRFEALTQSNQEVRKHKAMVAE